MEGLERGGVLLYLSESLHPRTQGQLDGAGGN